MKLCKIGIHKYCKETYGFFFAFKKCENCGKESSRVMHPKEAMNRPLTDYLEYKEDKEDKED